MALPLKDESYWPGAEPAGSSRQVFLGIMEDLDAGMMVPGQRLVETDLAQRFGVGRNAVREAMQHLAARGIIDLSPNRSPAIRSMGLAECLEVLEVAESLTRLMARRAAEHYEAQRHKPLLDAAREALAVKADAENRTFEEARRHYYRALLAIGQNRELQRLFPAVGMHVLHIQYTSGRLRAMRLEDYAAVLAAVEKRDPDTAESAVTCHIGKVREMVVALARSRD